MKITNTTSKIIVLIDGTKLNPYSDVSMPVAKGSELFMQIKALEKRGSLKTSLI